MNYVFVVLYLNFIYYYQGTSTVVSIDVSINTTSLLEREQNIDFNEAKLDDK